MTRDKVAPRAGKRAERARVHTRTPWSVGAGWGGDTWRPWRPCAPRLTRRKDANALAETW